MTAREFLKKWKIHLVFGGGFLLVFLVNVAINIFSGQTLVRSMVSALGSIRPVEYVMFALFWYAMTSGQRPDARPSFTTLNLRDP